MKIQIKKLNPKAMATRAYEGDAGLDLIAISQKEENGYIEYGTGIAIAIPHGYVGLLFPRSSISNKSLMFTNAVGVIDSGYRGEIKVRTK